jgi:two-component system sensor histidine kinase/response regulator
MHAILGYTQLLMKDIGLQSSQREYLDIISRSGNHLLNLLNDVLEMSKIEAGKITLNKVNFGLYELLNDIEIMFAKQAQAKGLSFDMRWESRLPSDICTDREKVRQVLINLLSNAVKFTDKGSVSISVKSELLPPKINGDEPARIFFEVEDTGCGIAPEEISKVFTPFEQTQSGIDLHTGTGLGMSISRQFAGLLGGDLRVKSNLGTGTVFFFDFTASIVVDKDLKTRDSAFSDIIYRYKHEHSNKISKDSVKIDPELPEEIKQNFLEALEEGDMSRMLEIIEVIGGYDAKLSDTMHHLANNFDYNGLVSILNGCTSGVVS